ncbi:MAG TPA: decaprenyl-phosphate phosphoribosyltransferase [Terriglobia bacterium]|nr:decaprenyl-phosphate phosphoribosyltransferase [Terriglobia bacterium]
MISSPRGANTDALETSLPVESHATHRRSTLRAVVETLRPQQWVKNGFVFAALIFSQSLTRWDRCRQVVLAAAVFCLVSSATYVLNDILDAPEDRHHPMKKLRPIASGRVSATTVGIVGAILGSIGLIAAWRLNASFFGTIVAYLAINVLYSTFLKRIALVDVFVVAAGFLLRVIAGGLVIRVPISPWLIVCTTLLALFIALSKRRHELVLLGRRASDHRAILADYSPYFLDQLISIVTASTVVSYALYTLSPDVQSKFPGKRLELTIPFVLFGIFRYLHLIHHRDQGGNPTRSLFTDPVLLSVVLLWAASVIFIIYL